MSNIEQTEPHDSATSKSNNLTHIVKGVLDISWYLNITLLIVMPIVFLLKGESIPSDIDQSHTDVSFYFNFKVFPEQLVQENNDLSNLPELIAGSGDIKLSNTKSSLAWYISALYIEIMGIVGLIFLFYIRKIFANFVVNDPFNKNNAKLFENFGHVYIAWSIIDPILTYLSGLAILSDVDEYAKSIQLSPTYYFSLNDLLIGLAILVFAGVMKEASVIHKEQSLTI